MFLFYLRLFCLSFCTNSDRNTLKMFFRRGSNQKAKPVVLCVIRRARGVQPRPPAQHAVFSRRRERAPLAFTLFKSLQTFFPHYPSRKRKREM